MSRMFKVGELISKYNICISPKGYCIVVDKDIDNYVLYNNSLKCLQRIAVCVVNDLFNTVVDDGGQ